MTVCPSLTCEPSATLYRNSVPATGAVSFSPPVPAEVCADEDVAAGLEAVGAADVAGFDTGAACAAAGVADVVDAEAGWATAFEAEFAGVADFDAGAEAAVAVFCVDAEDAFSFTLTA